MIERNKSDVSEAGREKERSLVGRELSWLLGVMFDSIT